jgi:HEPN domain-containing protein
MREDTGSKQKRRVSRSRTAEAARRLWEQAEADLYVARANMQPRCYYNAVFLCHQSAEKALKAAHWHLRGEEPPWTHDLAECVQRIVEREESLPSQVVTAVQYLQPLFADTRYPVIGGDEPIPVERIGSEEGQQSIEEAEEILAWVRTLLALPPGRPGHPTPY